MSVTTLQRMGIGLLTIALLLAGSYVLYPAHPAVVQAQQTVTVPPQRPYIPMPYEIDTSSSTYTRFKAGVDNALKGQTYYAFSAVEPAIMYRLTGEQKYADLAIKLVDDQVKAEEAKIAAGQLPSIAGTYLYSGPKIESLAIVYDWMYDLLTPEQRSRWSAYAEQTIYNIWHPTQATWNGVLRKWSGWSVNNPGNNYHFSFLFATMHWGLASNNETWLNFLANDKLPKLVTYYNAMPGGGSREGVQYGESHARLFALYSLWQKATGVDLSAANTHTKDSIEYWVHAMLPNRTNLAPIGDMARDSSAKIYDYYRKTLLEAIALNRGTPEAAHGNWVLANIPLNKMRDGFNLRYDFLFDPTAPQVKPTALTYFAAGAGHLFARSSWETDATWFSFVNGTYDESHAHQDNGSFMIYKNKWLAIDEAINSYSGIRQGTELHNLVRFKKGEVTLPQKYGKRGTMSHTDTNGVVSITADMSAFYAPADVASWQRQLVFDRNQDTVHVHDTFAPGTGVTGVWQLNVPVQPVRNGNTIVAGDLTITLPEPNNYQVAVVDWKTVDPAEYIRGGWKIELSGATEYVVDLKINSSGPAVTPSPTPSSAPVNRVPTLSIAEEIYDVELGQNLLIPLQASDQDGDPVTLTIPNLAQLLPGATLTSP